MGKNCFHLASMTVALVAILMASGCTILPQKQLRTYPDVNRLPESSILVMADEAFRQMGYATRYDHGGILGQKELDHWRIAILVVVGTDAQGNRFLEGASGVDAKGLEGAFRVRETAVQELQKFHEVFGALAVQSGLPTSEVQKTDSLSTPPPEQEPKGFE